MSGEGTGSRIIQTVTHKMQEFGQRDNHMSTYSNKTERMLLEITYLFKVVPLCEACYIFPPNIPRAVTEIFKPLPNLTIVF